MNRRNTGPGNEWRKERKAGGYGIQNRKLKMMNSQKVVKLTICLPNINELDDAPAALVKT